MVIYRSSELIIFRNSRAAKHIQTRKLLFLFLSHITIKDYQKFANKIVFRSRLIFNYIKFQSV